MRPKWKRAVETRVRILLVLRRYDEAYAFAADNKFKLKKLESLLPTEPNLKLLEAEKYKEDGDWESTILRLQEVLELDPTMARAYALLGEYYGKQGQYEKAITYDKKALSLSRKDVVSRSNLASDYFQLGQYRQAEKYAKKAIRKKPGFATPYLTLAAIYEKTKPLGWRKEVAVLKREAKARGTPKHIYE